jgi:hypothetical protein
VIDLRSDRGATGAHAARITTLLGTASRQPTGSRRSERRLRCNRQWSWPHPHGDHVPSLPSDCYTIQTFWRGTGMRAGHDRPSNKFKRRDQHNGGIFFEIGFTGHCSSAPCPAPPAALRRWRAARLCKTATGIRRTGTNCGEYRQAAGASA